MDKILFFCAASPNFTTGLTKIADLYIIETYKNFLNQQGYFCSAGIRIENAAPFQLIGDLWGYQASFFILKYVGKRNNKS
ncbi:MAG: hypothetical protein A3J63_04860 [Candidatus Moranbacteria bacterium RIFCSPHIGHO2_02_FULL_40_12b]|nr:MAG: hypothetical protein A3J63_04860 [Candidatus Moranbacteria bacterium RIFCSPHIGHO2_02_FULL_40_12b]OGI23070.1 MAG: hypothetical protein A3E91_00820 [Candidatus Moranbacteria bacterium RIFCSPHIGHO2_12_FULL_40_10]